MEKFMLEALKEAKKAYKKNEVPVGAVIVKDGEIIARAHNLCVTKKNPIYHAEVLAIQKACKVLGDWRLSGCDIYVTLEPCAMCCGSIINSRIDRLIYGASEQKGGFAGSIFDISKHTINNHKVKVVSGIMANECSEIIKNFFKQIRGIK